MTIKINSKSDLDKLPVSLKLYPVANAQSLFIRKGTRNSRFLVRINRGGKRTFVTHPMPVGALPFNVAKKWALEELEQATKFVPIKTSSQLGSFGGLLITYIDSRSKIWSASHHRATINRVNILKASALWELDLASMSRGDILSYLEAMAVKTPDQARKMLAIINPAIEYGWEARGIESCERLYFRKNPLPKRRQVNFKSIADMTQIKAMYQAIDATNYEQSIRLALKAIMLTAGRSGSVISLPKSAWDGTNLTFKRESLKVKVGRDYDLVLPVGKALAKVLDQAIKLYPQSTYLFAGRDPQKHVSQTIVQQLCTKVSDGKAVPHGFRASLVSFAVANNYNATDVDPILDHAKTGVNGKHYDRSELTPLSAKILLEYQKEFL